MRAPRVERIEGAEALDAEHQRHLDACHAIRHTVFVEEQAVPSDLEWDGLDAEAEHFILYTDPAPGAQAKGTARLRVIDGIAKAERVAVLGAERGAGLGRALMRAVEERAHALGLDEIRLNAQASVIDFYADLGYHAEGDVFVEAGIDHRAMRKRLR